MVDAIRGLPKHEVLDIAVAAGEGSANATTDLVNHCLPQVSAYLARRGAADPEALANQVMAEFVRALPRLEFASSERMWGYLYSVARSRLYDEHRRTRPEDLTERIEAVDLQRSNFDQQLADQLWANQLLAELTTDQRQVVELRFREDLTLEETAKRTGKSLTAVKALQRRALATLAIAVGIAAAVALILVNPGTFRDGTSKVSSEDPANSSIDGFHGGGEVRLGRLDDVGDIDDPKNMRLGPAKIERDITSDDEASRMSSSMPSPADAEPEGAMVRGRRRSTSDRPGPMMPTEFSSTGSTPSDPMPEPPPADVTPDKTPPAEPTPDKTPPAEPTSDKVPPADVTSDKAPPAEPTSDKVPPADVTSDKTPPAEPTPDKTPPADVTSDKTPPAEPTPDKVPPADVTPDKAPPAEPTPDKTPPADVTPDKEAAHPPPADARPEAPMSEAESM